MIENYLEKHYKDIDKDKFLELLFQEEYVYTLSYLSEVPKRPTYLTQEIEGNMVSLLFTSKEKAAEYQQKEPLLKDWKIIKIKTAMLDSYIDSVMRQQQNLQGFILNYGFYWATLIFDK